MTEDDLNESLKGTHTVERFSHALYGLIIVTATLVAEATHVTEVRDALSLLAVTAVVLLLAHTYSAFMAVRATEGPLDAVARRILLFDNLPVLGAIVVPAALFILAGLDVMLLERAYTLAVLFCIAALFGLGVYEARTASMSWVRAIGAGLLAATIGGLVVFLEAFAD